MKVALTGAAGHLGAAILQELCKRKIRVKALYRDKDTRSCTNLPVETVYGNMMDSGVLEELMRDCTAVIHAAALISVNGDRNGLVYKTNVEGTKLAIDKARESAVKRFIQISSIHAFQQKPSQEMLDENRLPVTDKAFAYDRSKQAGKEIALSANGPLMEVLVIHPSSIIGPFDFKPSLLGNVIIDLQKGKLPFIFNGGFDFCDNRDVAIGVVNSLNIGKPGESYILAGKWHSLKQLTDQLSDVSLKKIKPFALSQFSAKLGLPLIKLLAFVKSKEPLYTIEAVDALFTGNRYISSQKAINELNYSIRPFDETIADTFHWFNNNGYLDNN